MSMKRGGAVKWLWWVCSMAIFTTMQKEQPHSPGTKFYMQSAILIAGFMYSMLFKAYLLYPDGYSEQ